jgi:hypothetical protein
MRGPWFPATACELIVIGKAISKGSDEVEDARALQILLQSIKTLAEKGLGRAN